MKHSDLNSIFFQFPKNIPINQSTKMQNSSVPLIFILLSIIQTQNRQIPTQMTKVDHQIEHKKKPHKSILS